MANGHIPLASEVADGHQLREPGVNRFLTGSALHQVDTQDAEPPKRRARTTRRDRLPKTLVEAAAQGRLTQDGVQIAGFAAGTYRPAAQMEEARARFLDLYAERGTLIECCRLAGLSYDAVVAAKERIPAFAAALAQAEQSVLEKLEREAMRRAVEGTVVRSRKFWHGQLVGEDVKTEYSDQLLTMLLRARAPERYRENSLITINQVIKAVEGFNPAEVLGLPSANG